MSNRFEDGTPYIFDSKMMEAYQRAFDLTNQYNHVANNKSQREEILSQLLKKHGEALLIIPDFHCEVGHNIAVGDNVIINHNCTLMDNTDIIIGNNVLIGPNTSLYTVNHSLNPEERVKGVCTNYPIKVGDNVWLGGNVVVMPGVSIGNNSVIGAGSVVTRSIPANVIAVGNPCRIIRKL